MCKNHRMIKTGITLLICSLMIGLSGANLQAKPPIYIAFQWHMHQPIYWPYETVVETQNNNRYSFSVLDVHFQRTGPYTSWPADAVEAGKNAGLDSLGAQVSFSGSLMENLNNIAGAGLGFSNWQARWRQGVSWKTKLGNPRLALIGFGYFHPLMGLIDTNEIRLQIQLQRKMLEDNMGADAATSKGIFPPETGFSPRMIPALADEGIEWVLVDSVHFERTHVDYPYTKGSNLVPPNPADQRNNARGISWVQLSNIWAPSKVAAPWGYQPHYVAYKDPTTGISKKIIAVPAARYEGNEDGRGGYGAFLYEDVMSQYEAYNTDDQHPMIVVLHHDGDNYGGGSESYYHSNFQSMINWLKANPSRFVCTTIQDYLDKFPPEKTDVIHVEDGSWAGADNGDPEFLKWNANPTSAGYSADRNSWSVITAAKNRIYTANDILGYSSVSDILRNSGNNTSKAWHYFLVAEASDYWYWDYAENGIWDSHPARAANQAMGYADKVIGGGTIDRVAPSIYIPQREPYNPGGYEWGSQPESSDFKVWTFVYDLSGLRAVTLKYRVDSDGKVDDDNLTYSGREWKSLDMTAKEIPAQTNPMPTYKADEYSAMITGQSNVLVDYYVEAEDRKGNIAKSPVLHVYVGQKGGSSSDLWSPANPTKNNVITITASKAGKFHWGVNGWKVPIEAYWPNGTVEFSDGNSVETPMTDNGDGTFSAKIGPLNNSEQVVTAVNFVFHYSDNTWSSPDQTIPINNDVPVESLTVSLTEPGDGAAVSGSVKISADVTGDAITKKVEFFVDGKSVGSDMIVPYSASWNTRDSEVGSEHSIYAVAYDTKDNQFESAPIKVTIATVLCGAIPFKKLVMTPFILGLALLPMVIGWRRRG